MKALSLILVGLGLSLAPLSGDDVLFHTWNKPLETERIEAFKVGEYLKYRVHYGIIDAGEAELMVQSEFERETGKAYHLVGKGWSTGMFNWFFKVEDQYESVIDAEHHKPFWFKRDVSEGGYEIYREVNFYREENIAHTEGQDYVVPENVHDLLSAFYYARTMDVSEMAIGDYFDIELFLDKEVFTMRMRYLGKEVVKSDLGKVNCLKFRPVVQAGNVFKDKEALSLWVTDDNMHIPVRAQADVLIGSIKLDLMEYRNTLGTIETQ